MRLSLARALYRNPKILLLDDILASLDATVARQVIERTLIPRKGTRVIISNDPGLLAQCDQVIWLRKGEIEFQGKFQDFNPSNF